MFAGLYCASFEIVELAATLIGMEGCDVNQRDFKSGTPPILATTREGYWGTFEMSRHHI